MKNEIQYSKHVIINAPIEEMIPHWTQNQLMKFWVPGLISMNQPTPGPIQAGTKFHFMAESGNKKLLLTIKIISAKDNKFQFTSETDHFTINGNIGFNVVTRGTEIYYTVHLKTEKFLTKLKIPLVEPALKKGHDQAFTNLKSYLESRERIRRQS